MICSNGNNYELLMAQTNIKRKFSVMLRTLNQKIQYYFNSLAFNFLEIPEGRLKILDLNLSNLAKFKWDSRRNW